MVHLDQAPTFTAEEASAIAIDQYDRPGIAEELPSERDQNFLLRTDSGKFILKIANATEQLRLLEAQNDAMTHLASTLSFCPRVILTKSGEAICQIQTARAPHYVRLFTYIDGVPLAKAEQSNQLLFGLGKRLGELSHSLSNFDNPAFHRDFHWDLSNGLNVIDEYCPLITDHEFRTQIERCSKVLDSTLCRTSELPRAIIHGDANDYNVLVRGEDIVGLIDFGDMIYSYRVGELAIALAYVVLNKTDPLASAKAVVTGYCSVFELSSSEIESLWSLLLMRICMSVCLAAHQQQQKPDNEYLEVSQSAIRTSLPRLLTIDPRLATRQFGDMPL